MKSGSSVALVLSLVAVFATDARTLAAPGDPDTSFNHTGRVITGINEGSPIGVKVLTDGKILVAGNDGGVALARYTSTGAPDTTLNGTGNVSTYIGNEFYGSAMAVQTDGKIYVAGNLVSGYVPGFSSLDGNHDFALARLTSEGVLDTSFNKTGVVVTDFNTISDLAQAIALQADGKIVVAGRSGTGPGDLVLMRHKSNGDLDPTFNGTGKVTTRFAGQSLEGKGVAVQPDGKILVAGNCDDDFFLARYTSAGALDTTFNGTGFVITDFGRDGYSEVATGITLQPDGRIIVSGYSVTTRKSDLAMARYTSEGALDTSFNGSGKVITHSDVYNLRGETIALQSNGKIIVTGYSEGAVDDIPYCILFRYTDTGTPDTGFYGTGMTVAAEIDDEDTFGRRLALQPDGKILVAGGTRGRLAWHVSLLRFEGDRLRTNIRRPDASIGLRYPPAKGGNIYNSTGAGQSQAISLKKGQSKTVYVTVENVGYEHGPFILKGTAGNRHFSVKYYRSSAEITSNMLAGKMTTGVLGSGQQFTVKARITALTAKAGIIRDIKISATSNAGAPLKDIVMIKAKSLGSSE